MDSGFIVVLEGGYTMASDKVLDYRGIGGGLLLCVGSWWMYGGARESLGGVPTGLDNGDAFRAPFL